MEFSIQTQTFKMQTQSIKQVKADLLWLEWEWEQEPDSPWWNSYGSSKHNEKTLFLSSLSINVFKNK